MSRSVALLGSAHPAGKGLGQSCEHLNRDTPWPAVANEPPRILRKIQVRLKQKDRLWGSLRYIR